jgi:hypothetical protein
LHVGRLTDSVLVTLVADLFRWDFGWSRRLLPEVDPVYRLLYFPRDIAGVYAFKDHGADLGPVSVPGSALATRHLYAACPDASSALATDNGGVVDESVLPDGWTLARVRSMEPHAELLDPHAHHVVADQRPTRTELEVLTPSAILSFSGLCLCRVPDDDGTSWWWMGQLDESDGSIVCWSPYSDDLGDAIRAL